MCNVIRAGINEDERVRSKLGWYFNKIVRVCSRLNKIEVMIMECFLTADNTENNI